MYLVTEEAGCCKNLVINIFKEYYKHINIFIFSICQFGKFIEVKVIIVNNEQRIKKNYWENIVCLLFNL